MENTEWIKILSHKQVIINSDVLDIVHLEDIVQGIKSEEEYKILSGKYKGKYIPILGESYKDDDFVVVPLTLVEKNLTTDFLPGEDKLISIDRYLKKCPNKEYHAILVINGNIVLKEFPATDQLVSEFKIMAYPSVSKDLNDLICGMKGEGSNGFTISPNLVDRMLGKENSLKTQNTNTHIKKLEEYNISEKYKTIRKRVIGLDEIKILLANITKNISLSYSSLSKDKVKELKSSILLIGASGTGKTFLIETIASLFDVPIVISDATRYTPISYQGDSLEDLLINLYIASGEKEDVFEHGIIFLDEFDKICKRISEKDSAVKEMVQEELLTIIQGTVIHKKIRHGFTEKTVRLDTSKLTFVLSGAFEEIIDKEKINSKNLTDYGMISQLAKRMRTIIKTSYPTRENLKSALVDGEYSYIKLFKEYLNIFDKDLEVDDAFFDYIVDKAVEEKSGYRGLTNALTEYLNTILFDIYDSKTNVVKLQIK